MNLCPPSISSPSLTLVRCPHALSAKSPLLSPNIDETSLCVATTGTSPSPAASNSWPHSSHTSWGTSWCGLTTSMADWHVGCHHVCPLREWSSLRASGLTSSKPPSAPTLQDPPSGSLRALTSTSGTTCPPLSCTVTFPLPPLGAGAMLTTSSPRATNTLCPVAASTWRWGRLKTPTRCRKSRPASCLLTTANSCLISASEGPVSSANLTPMVSTR
mmetsp:Transcript_39715/g.99438  ORF Transcript_39715/g.99438 Transcript_39715/m.99438 type:complete len:216 (-) Transcript_39715:518-1165(-)